WLVVTEVSTKRSHRVSNERGLYFLGTAPWSPDGTRFTAEVPAGVRRPHLHSHSPQQLECNSSLRGPGTRAPGRPTAVGSHSTSARRAPYGSSQSTAARNRARFPFTGCLPTWRPSP